MGRRGLSLVTGAVNYGRGDGRLNLSPVLLVASMCALGMYDARAWHLAQLPILLICAVLLAATLFGAVPGLVVLLLAGAAYWLQVGEAWPGDPVELVLLLSSGVIACGAYTDHVRRQSQLTLTLRQAAAPLNARARGFEVQAARRAISMSPRDETRRALVSLSVVGTAAVVGVLWREALGWPLTLTVLIAGSAMVGGLLGARFGLFAGLITWLAVELLAPGPAEPWRLAIGMGGLGALGCGVGLLADRASNTQHVVETLVTAGRELSSTSSESDIRRGLLESLANLSPRSRVQICEGDGPVLTLKESRGGDWSPGDPRWRTRVLSAGDREVGLVRWWFPGARREVEALDEIAVALIDLAASAIVRERLNVEKGDIELVARTEHLRTILLDAVAHHFRSPLAGILGSVTSILNLPDDHDRKLQRELLFIIKDQANRLGRYVDNFLSVARLEAGNVEVTPEDVHLEPLIYDVWEKFDESGAAHRFLTADTDQTAIRTDGALLAQALGNVLENAVKYSPEGSTVAIRSHRVGDEVVIEIDDEGPGIPAERISRIFERFYRSRAEGVPGLGLGLYITRSLIEILGGRVEAGNRGDGVRGLRVTIVLPLRGPPS